MLSKGVMNRDKPDDTTPPLPQLTIFRGLFSRVARRLGIDPSFVSRVARGERSSPPVLAALQEEMRLLREHLNNHHQVSNNGHSGNGNSSKGKTAKTRPSGPPKCH